MTDKFLYAELDQTEAWSALERFATQVATDPRLPLILPCEFMFMVAHDEEFGRVYEYKHKASGRYLVLTAVAS